MFDALQAIVDKVLRWFREGVFDTKLFLVSAAEYAADQIDDKLMEIVAECTAAAEQMQLENGKASGPQKKEFAWSNIVSIAIENGIEFAVADINFAIEAVIQHRNREAAKAAP